MTWRVTENEMRSGGASLEIWSETWSGFVSVNGFCHNNKIKKSAHF